jgi:hypothetical protein
VLLRIAFTTYEKATEKRFGDLEKAATNDEAELKSQVYDLREANHSLEKSQLKFEGELKLLSAGHESSRDDISSIKRDMITKSEFEPRMNHMEKMLTTILHAVERTPGRYTSHSSLGAVRVPQFESTRGGERHDTPPKGVPR